MEVDFVIEHEGALMPVEVKAAARPRLSDTDGLKAFLDEYPDSARHGILVHTGDAVEALSPRIWGVPLSLALGVTHGMAAGANHLRAT
jgi:hypothetical protein